MKNKELDLTFVLGAVVVATVFILGTLAVTAIVFNFVHIMDWLFEHPMAFVVPVFFIFPAIVAILSFQSTYDNHE